MIKRLAIVLVLTLILFAVLFGARFSQIAYAKENHYVPPPPTVAATRVRTEEWQPVRRAVGSLVARRGVTVSNELPGIVTAIHFKSGDIAAAGDPLIELDATADQAELRRLRANQRLAKIELDRAQRLATKSFASKSDLDVAQAQLEQANAAVELQQAIVAKKNIVAPFSGILGIRQVDLGQFLPPGSEVVPLQDLDTLFLDFTLPENQMIGVKTGFTVQIRVDAYPDREFSGVITAINPKVEKNSRNLKLRATLNNDDHALRPGMFAEVTLLLGSPKPVLTIPATAVTYTTYGDTVFIIQTRKNRAGDEEFFVARQPIQTGETRNDRVEVTAGLKENDYLVSAGQVKLREGIAVLISDLPTPDERD